MDPETIGERIPQEIAETKIQIMRRAVLTLEGAVRKRTRVRTGHLRRFWYSKVEKAGERGRVGTTVKYALFQKNKPLHEGLEDSDAEIRRILAEVGEELFTRVVS